MAVLALLQQNPLMVYAGQEYGERGMDKEGFSGCDGRTTIFDYWSVDTLVRAAQKKLTTAEKRLKAVYDQLLVIARREKAVSEGLMFDLMYANPHLQRQYAFLRKKGRETLLVVANFDTAEAATTVTIPQHAFDYLKLRQHAAIEARDLLTDAPISLSLKADTPISLTVPSCSALVLKF